MPLWLLALITLSGTLGMHIFIPALPQAGQDLGADAQSIQMTVTLYIVGLALGQLVYGPLADRFGRRSVLLGGLALFASAGLAAALAPGVRALIAARLFQALGGCAGLVLGRAIVRDVAEPKDAARRLALMNLMVTLGPGLAPLAGSALAAATGWRSIFYVLCAFGLLNATLAWRLLPETAPRTANPGLGKLARNYAQLLSSPAFLGYALGGACATTSVYAFIAAAPFIFVSQLHRSMHEVGVYLAILVSGLWLGSVLTSRLILRVPLVRLLVGANLVSVVAAAALLAAVLSGLLSVPIVIGSMFVYAIGTGIAAPTALTQAVSVNTKVIGSASGLYGFTQMAIGALCTAFAGIGSSPALATALVLASAGVLAQASFWIALRRDRRGA